MSVSSVSRGACVAIAVGLLATAPLALGRNGADDGVRASGDDRVMSRGSDDGPGDDRGGRRDRARADVRVAGTCTGPSTAKLKLSPENGRVEVEFEVDQNRIGRRWGVVLKRNGAAVVRRAATTTAPSGSFEVRAVIAPGSPRTTVAAVARAVRGGEVCRATATMA